MFIWWNRDLDNNGHQLRLDVREAANSIFAEACRRTRAVLGEDCDAAALMEELFLRLNLQEKFSL